jgi:hypothetical protein
MGFMGSVWTLDPLGGIYWLWKLKQHKFDEEFNTETEEIYYNS